MAPTSRGNSAPTVLLYSVPLDLAPILRDDLFGRLSSTVVTSATLTAERELRLPAGPPRPGRRRGERRDGAVSVAVRLRRECVAGGAERHAGPESSIRPGISVRWCTHVLDVAEASDGGMFVLCTSHRDVRALAPALARRGAPVTAGRCWCTARMGATRCCKRFRQSGRAILVGTATFWEGVDVPGHALRGLVINKLPFRVPTEPMVAAQCDAIEARGGDSFMEYMLPHATLRLKQGVGRLIRTATDRGVIVLDDVRVVTKRYGRDLLDALPPAPRVLRPWAEAERLIIDFYAARAAETVSTF